MKYLILDTETGGLGLQTSLLQIGLIIANEKFEMIDVLSINVKPDEEKGGRSIYHVQAEGLAINKINLVEHEKTAIPYKQVGQRIYQFLDFHGRTEKLIPTGKNIHGDLNQIFDKIMNKSTWEQFVSYQHMDLSAVWTFLTAIGKVPELESSSLRSIAEYYKINTSDLHDALFDCRVTLQILRRVIYMFSESTGVVFPQ